MNQALIIMGFRHLVEAQERLLQSSPPGVIFARLAFFLSVKWLPYQSFACQVNGFQKVMYSKKL